MRLTGSTFDTPLLSNAIGFSTGALTNQPPPTCVLRHVGGERTPPPSLQEKTYTLREESANSGRCSCPGLTFQSSDPNFQVGRDKPSSLPLLLSVIKLCRKYQMRLMSRVFLLLNSGCLGLPSAWRGIVLTDLDEWLARFSEFALEMRKKVHSLPHPPAPIC